MNALDIITVVIISLTTFYGLWKGLVKQVFGIAGLVAGYLLAIRFYEAGSLLFAAIEPGAARVVSFSIIFIGTVVAATIAGLIVSRFMKAVGLSWINRVTGGALGLLKGLAVILVIVVVLFAFLPSHDPMIRDSVTLPLTLTLSSSILRIVPEDIKKQYRQKLDEFSSFVPLKGQAQTTKAGGEGDEGPREER